jgi:hypothetical protein
MKQIVEIEHCIFSKFFRIFCLIKATHFFFSSIRTRPCGKENKKEKKANSKQNTPSLFFAKQQQPTKAETLLQKRRDNSPQHLVGIRLSTKKMIITIKKKHPTHSKG